MKKIVAIVIVLIAVVFIASPAFTNNPYTELYQVLETADGAATEGIISELGNCFVENPEKFLKEYKKQDASVQSLVAINFAYIAQGEEDYAINMRETILSVKDNPAATEIVAAYQKVRAE